MQHLFDPLINSYLDDQVGIDTQFLTPELASGLQQNIRDLQHHAQMKMASIGNQRIKDPQQQMRSDKIYWLDKSHNNAFENQFLLQAENFIA
jgi:SM-20-related protein